jgi:tetratricopeptide (TPR) repeat protein
MLEDCNQALQIDPDLAVAYAVRGYAWQFLKQYDRAIQDYDQANRLDPNSVMAYSGRALPSPRRDNLTKSSMMQIKRSASIRTCRTDMRSAQLFQC